MKINTNTWNRIRYTLYTPVYDWIAGYLRKSRKKSIDTLGVKPGDKVLIIGAGTGLDLAFLPVGSEITATDITTSMVDRIKKRNMALNLNVQAMVMDGHSLDFDDNTFDKIILHLIISVIPNPIACIKESERVLKPGGQMVVYDKFLPEGRNISFVRKITNLLTNFLFSDITRSFKSIVSNTRLKILSDTEADFNGNFRIIKMIK